MILTTPLDASVPYNVAAAGPLITSTDWISAGLMSCHRDGGKVPAPGPVLWKSLLTRTPSMYRSGWDERAIEPMPLMRMLAPAIELELLDRCTLSPGCALNNICSNDAVGVA